GVERVKDRVGAPVELERLDAKAPAQLVIEDPRRLEPLSLEEEFGVPVVDEEIRAHALAQARGRQVILDVGEPDARRNAKRARAGREQRRLADAKSFAALERARRAVRVVLREVE